MDMLHHLAISASNLKHSAPFYEGLLGILGYEPKLKLESICTYVGRRPEILVYAADTTKPHDRHQLFNPGWHHCALQAPDRTAVETVHAYLLEKGSVILDPPCECPEYAEGYYAVYFEDPDGLKWEVAHIPNDCH